MEYTINEGRITITVWGDYLRVLEQRQMKIWHTPGDRTIYAASRPRFTHDVVIATPETFLYCAGYTESTDLDDTESMSVTVDLT